MTRMRRLRSLMAAESFSAGLDSSQYDGRCVKGATNAFPQSARASAMASTAVRSRCVGLEAVFSRMLEMVSFAMLWRREKVGRDAAWSKTAERTSRHSRQ